MNSFMPLAAALIAAGCLATAAEFAPGGTTYDFQAASDRRLAPSAGTDNLLGEWKSAPPWVHLANGERAKELRTKITPLVEFKTLTLPEGKAYQTIKPNEIETVAGADAANVSGSWVQKVTLPDALGGRFKLEFQYRAKGTGKYAAAGYAIITFADANRKTVGKTQVKGFPIGNGVDPQLFASEIEAPAGAVQTEIYLRLDGCGEVIFIAPKLMKCADAAPISLLLAPGALLDNRFALSQNDPAVITFAWRRNQPAEQFQLNAPVLHLQLPAGVTCKSAAAPLTMIGGKDGHWQLSIESIRDRLKRFDGYDAYLLLPAMLFTELAPGAEPGTGSAWITDGGKVVSDKSVFSFSVLPQIPAAAKPSQFLNGFQIGGLYLNFEDPAARELWAKFVGRTGMRWLAGSSVSSMTELYRANGISMITPELYWVANGYRVGPPENKPESAKFKPLGVSSDFNILNGTCPTAIYRKSDYFTKVIVPYLEQNLKGADGLIANWEPYMFHGMGCFCDNCRDEFVTFSKLSADEVKQAWPQELLINRKHHALGIKFRSWQHAQMVKAIDEAVNAVTTGKAGFVPEVAWIHMIDCAGRDEATGEHDPLDYAGSFKYIDPWGPYACWKALEPYTYVKGVNLDTYIAARGIVDFTKRNFKAPNRPKLLALPHGMQCDFWVTQPEAAAMEVLGFFVAGFDAATLYLFPKGYDNRFWAAQADANDLIAANEAMVLGGERIPVSVAPYSPFPAPKKRINAKYFADSPEESLLQAAAFRKDDRILVAVGNYWEKGDVFFTCRVPGMNPGKEYVVREAQFNRTFAGINGKNYTGEEISKGFKLHTGALRWAFFVIEPAGNASAPAAELVKSDEFAPALAKRLPALQAAADFEAKRDQAEDQLFRKSELKELASGALNCTPGKSADGSQILEFRSGKNTLRLGLNGMAVQSWAIDGRELLAGGTANGLGALAFWQPSLQLEQPFFLTEQKAVPGGISVSGEWTVTKKQSAALVNCKVRQTVEVNDALTLVKFRTELLNASDDESGRATMKIGFRYHIMPLCLGNGGVIELGKDRVEFRRKSERLIFSNGDPETAAVLKKLFEAPGALIPINGANASWRSPQYDFTVNMNLTPADQFAGIACWDTPNLKAPTMEPFFRTVTLPPDRKAEFSLELKITER